MDKNIAIILSVAAIILTVTCVGATVINNDSEMKQDTFDGIKMNVPHDAKFIEIPGGFKENTYGITVNTFKDNQSMVNFLNGLQGAKVISLNDQPPQSVAYTQGDNTYILITNGKEGICVGAVDQKLVLKMSNSVIFSNGHPSERSHGFMSVGQKHLDKDKDFNCMIGIIQLVNNPEININTYATAIATTVVGTNYIIDAGTTVNQNAVINTETTQFENITDSSGNIIINDTSNGESSDVSGGIPFIESDNGDSNSGDAGSSSSDSGVSPSTGDNSPDISDITPDNSGSSSSGDSSSSSSDDSSSSSDDEPEPYTQEECQVAAEAELGDGEQIVGVTHNGDIYIFEVVDEEGNTVTPIKVDSLTCEVL